MEKAKALVTARNLMERALDLLDAVGEAGPAVHLQMALDTLTGVPIARAIEGTPSPQAIERADGMIRAHGDTALGRARMQLYEAMGRRETGEVDLLSSVCGILMERGYR
ncbi:hypothetical protein IH86_15075 [Sphingobium yanoikuyae]|nr:hypothetical protein IH86_15075 [Sphingobium yanoikuyae]